MNSMYMFSMIDITMIVYMLCIQYECKYDVAGQDSVDE